MTEKITNKVLEKIKKEEIKPEAKWKFLLKDYLVWGLFVLALIVGALAVAVIIFGIKISDWDMSGRLAGGPIRFLIMTLSYFWLLIFVAFVLVAYYNFKHTKKGYKYNIFVIIGVSLLSTILLGSLAYSIGWGEKLENSLVGRAPFYQGMQRHRQEMWSQPERGLLVGKILRVEEDKFFLEDIGRKEWQVFSAEAQLSPMVVVETGEMIRILGQILAPAQFRAERIMPWQKMGGPPPMHPPIPPLFLK